MDIDEIYQIYAQLNGPHNLFFHLMSMDTVCSWIDNADWVICDATFYVLIMSFVKQTILDTHYNDNPKVNLKVKLKPNNSALGTHIYKKNLEKTYYLILTQFIRYFNLMQKKILMVFNYFKTSIFYGKKIHYLV